MKLACNYSPELMALLARDEAPIDYIKAGAFGLFLPEIDRMVGFRPVLLHGMGRHERSGMPNYESLDYAWMNGMLQRCGSPHLAIHMGITRADVGPGMTEEGMFRRMADCAAFFRRSLAVPLLLENTGDTPEERTVYDLIPFVEPERISRLLEEAEVLLLLDLTHAKVTAQYRKWDIHDYLSALPLGRVREIHITGSGFDAEGAPYDAHGPMEDADFALLEWALARTRPHVVTLEYGYPAGFDGPQADMDILKEQLRHMSEIVM